MTLNISEHAFNLLTYILEELTGEEYAHIDEKNCGLPSCVFCDEVFVVGPDKINHDEHCLTAKALELLKELSRENRA